MGLGGGAEEEGEGGRRKREGGREGGGGGRQREGKGQDDACVSAAMKRKTNEEQWCVEQGEVVEALAYRCLARLAREERNLSEEVALGELEDEGLAPLSLGWLGRVVLDKPLPGEREGSKGPQGQGVTHREERRQERRQPHATARSEGGPWGGWRSGEGPRGPRGVRAGSGEGNDLCEPGEGVRWLLNAHLGECLGEDRDDGALQILLGEGGLLVAGRVRHVCGEISLGLLCFLSSLMQP